MGLEIRILTDYDEDKTPAEQIDAYMAALGFVRKTSVAVNEAESMWAAFEHPETKQTVVVEPPRTEPGPDTRGIMNVGLEHAEAGTIVIRPTPTGQSVFIDAFEKTRNSGRKPGEPSSGHKRRTKAEMAEDAAYLASLDHAPEIGQEEIPNGEAEMIAEYREQGGFESDDIIAQDAADEAAETASEQTGALTLEDLRRAIGEYAKKHGMPKAATNVPAILGGPMLEVTDFEMAVGRIKLATATSDGLLHEEAPHATKDDLMEAVMAYAAKAEGSGVKPASSGPTAVDLADVMRKTFPGTSGALSEVPATPEGYGKALAAVNATINSNLFKRW